VVLKLSSFPYPLAAISINLPFVLYWWGNWRERDHWGDLGIVGWIILGWISRRWDVVVWTGLGWPWIERVGGRL